MKALALTSTLLTALALTAFGQGDSTLRSKISLKEKQLAEIQKELGELRSRLNRPSNGSYTVQTGDTLHSISQRYNVSVSEIMKWNKISDPTKLSIGDQLVVSASGSKSTTPTSKSTSSADYVISKGDTFYSIARRHKMSLTQLRTLNPDVSTHQITPGQTLRVSGKAPERARATVVVKKTNKPAPKVAAKSSTSKKATSPSRPAKKTETVAKKTSQTPISRPPAPPVMEDPEPKASAVAIILTNEITFEEFASKHGTSTDQLNALNGWNLPKSTLLAPASEIFVPN